MPELPEVETVREGLQRWIVGRTVSDVEIGHPRAVRRHLSGPSDLRARLVGRRVRAALRRGKYLWLPLGPGLPSDSGLPPDSGLPLQREEALVAHLGMSGQLLVRPGDTPDERHLHVRIGFADGGPELRFVDQRTFGSMMLDRLVPAGNGGLIPERLIHIARDPMDPAFDDAGFLDSARRRNSPIKRALLDQTLISGIGNIYADEALWRAQVHGDRLTRNLSRAVLGALLGQVRAVLGEAVSAGGTSFDALYVNVNGQSGYFSRSLAVYGRAGGACPRCGTPIRRAAFMNRSSFFCPSCQRPPRRRS
ncbi:MAG: bifunctional DNA-formamidopyrimidine glycosylase/DNA-(apurinic or apyrimidinic site) lyase [Actinomycetota bacterium]|nr:bifunctional DNA-formamidopyrimidine glycosylase/DNA-(apurinic or apyrimidinic site) lyase [Actinomycetota bacterium]